MLSRPNSRSISTVPLSNPVPHLCLSSLGCAEQNAAVDEELSTWTYTPPRSNPPQHPLTTQEHANSSSVSQPQGATMELDANCNSYHNLLGSEALSSAEISANELTSCLQSQARLVVATQNYYKLVTCDLSSQSSPSPAGSSVTSCSDEHSKGSPTQPTEILSIPTNERRGRGRCRGAILFASCGVSLYLAYHHSFSELILRAGRLLTNCSPLLIPNFDYITRLLI